jgi:predicted SprT family Zn-dependent metalloprotease
MRDTIEMAREAEIGDSHGHIIAHELAHLKVFEALVRADEREACAKVCDELPLVEGAKQVQRATLKDAATAIRARGNT